MRTLHEILMNQCEAAQVIDADFDNMEPVELASAPMEQEEGE